MGAREPQDVPRRVADLDGYDAYGLLGVDADADRDEIEAAYRREMARAHPDRGGSARRAQLVNCARDVLLHHRDHYDELVAEPSPPFGSEVLFIAPDVAPLDDVGPPAARRWWSVAGVLLVGLAVVGLVSGLVSHEDGDAPAGPSSATTSGWTTRQIDPGAPPPSSPSSPSSLPGVPAALTPTPRTVVVSVSAPPTGGGHRCEVRADGTLWCAGGNARGQVGNGSARDVGTPVRVGAPGIRWSAVAVGGQSTCALQAGGALWCWGDNTYGQLGDGTNSARSRPVPVEPADRWLAIDLDTHACAVRADHTLWCWGAGGRGQLGGARPVDEATPLQLGREDAWAAVTVGTGWTCGVRQDGSRQCWGTRRV